MQGAHTLFITGSTGFVGAALARHFTAAGYEVTGSGRVKAPSVLLDMMSYIQADICHPMQPVQADAVIHAAALASDTASEADLLQANISGLQHVFEATRSCPVFVYISSSSVYDSRQRIHREDEPIDLSLLSAYGRSKRLAEEWLLQQDWRNRTLIILRPRAIYGRGDRVLLPRLLRLVRGGRIFIPGDMRIQSSLTHIGNLCAATEHSIRHFSANPGGAHVFNICDKAPYEMRAAVSGLLSAVYNRELRFVEMPLAPLQLFATVMEKSGVATSFTPLSLASVTRDNLLSAEQITEMTGFEPLTNLWDEMGCIGKWAQQVGLEALRKADPLLPWK